MVRHPGCSAPSPSSSLVVRAAMAASLVESMSVSGDSISRGFNANTSSCNYADTVSRVWATGVDHGGSFCSAGGATFSHAERLECAKNGPIVAYNNAASGADMLHDFFNQAHAIKLGLSAESAPRYVPVFLGHNDICTNTTSRTGNSCGGDEDPNNYCRTTPLAFEREFRRGMDELIQIPSARIGVSALARVSELCNFGSKQGCGLTSFGDCGTIWSLFPICQSLTEDCSNQRRIDAYETALDYNEILERVTAEYAAIPTGFPSATGAVRAPDVHIRYSEGAFAFKFGSSDVSCCDCFHPSDQGQAKIAQFGWDGLQCSASTPCCAPSGTTLGDARCDAVDTTTFYPSGFWPGGMPCGNGIVDPTEQCDDGNNVDGDCCSSSCQFEAAGSACAADANPCTNDVCNGAGACTHPNNTAPCDDGLFCIVNDVCGGGTCGGSARGCSAAGNQCNLGTCNEATDQCVTQPRPNGTTCTDGNACTQSDTCQGGTCTGANPVACSAQDQCHVAGTCNPLTGTCSNPSAPNGAACNDGDACTQSDTCQGGACSGASPVVCTAQDQCHTAGTCNPATGTCSNPTKPNGAACNDGNACTQSDTCQAGACAGASPVVCHGAGSMPRRGDLQSRDGHVLESRQVRRRRLHRRQPLHPDRHLPGRELRGGQSGRVHGARPVPRRRRVQHDHRDLLQSAEVERRPVQRRERVHARRQLPGRCVRERELRRVHRARPVPPPRGVRPAERRLLEPAPAERRRLQRRRRLHDRRRVSGRRLRHRESRRVHRAGPVSRCGHLHSVYRHLLTAEQGERDRVQRRKRLHAERHVPGRCVRRREPRRVHGARPVPRCGDVQPDDRRLLESAQADRRGLRRRRRLHADRHVPGRSLHRRRAGRLSADRHVPRGRHLQSRDRRVRGRRRTGRHAVGRRQCLHYGRRLQERRLRRRSGVRRRRRPGRLRRRLRRRRRERHQPVLLVGLHAGRRRRRPALRRDRSVHRRRGDHADARQDRPSDDAARRRHARLEG